MLAASALTEQTDQDGDLGRLQCGVGVPGDCRLKRCKDVLFTVQWAVS